MKNLDESIANLGILDDSFSNVRGDSDVFNNINNINNQINDLKSKNTSILEKLNSLKPDLGNKKNRFILLDDLLKYYANQGIRNQDVVNYKSEYIDLRDKLIPDIERQINRLNADYSSNLYQIELNTSYLNSLISQNNTTALKNETRNASISSFKKKELINLDKLKNELNKNSVIVDKTNSEVYQIKPLGIGNVNDLNSINSSIKEKKSIKDFLTIKNTTIAVVIVLGLTLGILKYKK